ncbi:MAG: nitroreductase family protein [Methanomassiliicoccales archaeon]|jgi:nitroreductase
MSDVLKNIQTRRSVRSYRDEKIPDEIVRELLKVGTLAPNGNNFQGLRFVVMENREKMDRYAAVAREMSKTNFIGIRDAATDPSQKEAMDKMVKMLSNPEFDIFYSAPLVIFIFTAPGTLTPVEDASLAAENMFLYANSIGIGSCWIGFGKALQFYPDFMAEAGVPPGHTLVAPLVFGYPKKGLPESHRKEPQVFKWIK